MAAPVLVFRNAKLPPRPPKQKKKKRRSDVSDEDLQILTRAYELCDKKQRAWVARCLVLGLPWLDERTPEEDQLVTDLLDIAQEYDPGGLDLETNPGGKGA